MSNVKLTVNDNDWYLAQGQYMDITYGSIQMWSKWSQWMVHIFEEGIKHGLHKYSLNYAPLLDLLIEQSRKF